MRWNIQHLDADLRADGIPIDGVSGTRTGRIDFRPEATREQRALAERIRDTHNADAADASEKLAKCRIALISAESCRAAAERLGLADEASVFEAEIEQLRRKMS